jgi:hypothetical protein
VHVLAVILALNQTQVATLKEDTQLAKPVTLRLKLAPLPEVIQAAAKETGVKLRVAGVVSDLKATVLVKEELAGNVLDALASTLRCEWQKDKDGYTLTMSGKEQNLLKSYLQAEDEANSAGTKKLLRQMMGIVAGKSWEEVSEERDKLQGKVTDIGTGRKPGWQDDLKKANEEFAPYRYFYNAESYYAATVARSWSEADWRRLGEGQTLYASTTARPGIPKLPDTAAVMHGRVGEVGSIGRMFLRLNPSGALDWRMDRYAGGNWSSNQSSISGPLDGSLAEHPFRQELKSWSTSTEELEKNQALQRIVKAEGADQRPSEYFHKLYSDADHQEWLFDRTGIAVVADAFRIPHYWSRLDRVQGRALDWLKAYQKATPASVRLEGNIVCLRRLGFWGYREAEIPEDVLRPIEAQSRQKAGVLSLTDYASLVSKLTSRQADWLASSSWTLLRFNDFPLKDALPFFRLYASLTGQQRSTLLTRRVLNVGDLGPNQQQAYLQAIGESAFASGKYMGGFLEVFDRPWDPAVLDEAKIWFVTEGVGLMGKQMQTPLDWGIDGEYRQPASVTFESFRFVLGKAADNGVAYQMAVMPVP